MSGDFGLIVGPGINIVESAFKDNVLATEIIVKVTVHSDEVVFMSSFWTHIHLGEDKMNKQLLFEFLAHKLYKDNILNTVKRVCYIAVKSKKVYSYNCY